MKRTTMLNTWGGFLLIAFLVLAMGCAGGPGVPAGAAPAGFPLAAEGAAFEKAELSAFAREALGSFSTFVLSNGVPVVVKQSTASRVQHLSLVIRGGSLFAKPETAGYEGLALRTMARGSAAYSYEAIQDLLDATSSSISAGTSFESSSFSLNTLDKYFDRLFPVWADCLVAPSLSEEDFGQVLSEAKLSLQSKEQDPWAKTGLVMNAEFFAGHPYAVSPDGTTESLAAATSAQIRDWYATAFSANRFFIVAVGDFDPGTLKEKLEATVGKIPDRRVALPPEPPRFGAAPPGPSGSGRLVKFEYPQSKGVGYLRGDFAAPSPSDSDFMAASIAMKMLGDLLFNVVRDKHGATYSPGAYIRSFEANYGSIVIYKTKVAAAVKAYVDEAVAELAAGRCLSVDPDDAESAEPRTSIEEALPTYKALFTSSYYESQQTNAQVAAEIAASVLSTGDYRSYLRDMERIEAVTPDELKAAFDKYILHGQFTWVALGSRDVVDPVREEDFGGFSAAR